MSAEKVEELKPVAPPQQTIKLVGITPVQQSRVLKLLVKLPFEDVMELVTELQSAPHIDVPQAQLLK